MRISPLTGKLTSYFQVYQHYVYDHQSVDMEGFQHAINQEYLTENIDAICEGFTVIRGGVTDTLIPSLWVAEDQPQLGRLIDPSTIAFLIWKVLDVIIRLRYVWLIMGIAWGASVIYTTFFGPKKDYYLPEESGRDTPVSWNEYISWLNQHYWYVCQKDGYAVAKRSDYPSITDVPQEFVDAFQSHCANAPDLSPKEWTNFLYVIGGIVIIGGVIWVAGKFLGGRRS